MIVWTDACVLWVNSVVYVVGKDCHMQMPPVCVQGIVWQLVWVGVVSNINSLFLHVFFIFILNMGFL